MPLSLSDLFDQFYNECQFVHKTKDSTNQRYRDTFELFAKHTPKLSLETINSVTITNFFRFLEERPRQVGITIRTGIKASTIATYSARLHPFFEWLVKHHYISENPLDQMRIPKPVYQDVQYLSKEQVERIIAAIHLSNIGVQFIQERNLTMFYILLYCGLRREELLLLQIRDIDLERKQLTVRAETSKSKMNRTIPLHSTIMVHLKEYLKLRNKYTSQYLFVSHTRDSRFTDDGMKHLLVNLVARSKVRFHLHQFRHTFAVNFLMATNNLAKLQQLLGHQDIRMTAVYLRCLPVNEMRKDIETMNLGTFL